MPKKKLNQGSHRGKKAPAAETDVSGGKSGGDYDLISESPDPNLSADLVKREIDNTPVRPARDFKDRSRQKPRPEQLHELNSLDEHRYPDSGGDEATGESGAGVNTGSTPAADQGLDREPRVEERLAEKGMKRAI